jgi:diphthamide synthase (EF-2-diphthine--ammonia ligase)
LPLFRVPLPWPCSNEQYEAAMSAALVRARADGVTAVVFGDLFLADIRAYREAKLAGTGIEPIFPLWQIPTGRLAPEMIDGGLRAVLTCVDPRQLPARFAGRQFDHALLADLPAGVDPCGERGEFHTFCWAGPMLSEPIAIRPGDIVERDDFVFADFDLAA